jgi:hypothetical protein
LWGYNICALPTPWLFVFSSMHSSSYLKPTSSTLNQLNTESKMMNLDFINGNGAKNHMLKEGINFGFHHEF